MQNLDTYKNGFLWFGLRLEALDGCTLHEASVGLADGGFQVRGKVGRDKRILCRAVGNGPTLEDAARDWALTVYTVMGLVVDF